MDDTTLDRREFTRVSLLAMLSGQLTLSLGPAVGVPDHTHSVTLTAAEVVSIRDGARVSKASSTQDAHDHTVTFT